MSVHFRRVADDNIDPIERGTYRRVLEYWAPYCARKGIPNTWWAELCCPGCGRGAMVGRNHTVLMGGIVTPSDVCPHEGCSFHEHIILDDWDRPATPRSDRHDGAPSCTGDE